MHKNSSIFREPITLSEKNFKSTKRLEERKEKRIRRRDEENLEEEEEVCEDVDLN